MNFRHSFILWLKKVFKIKIIEDTSCPEHLIYFINKAMWLEYNRPRKGIIVNITE